jgi:hypothetical protein
VLYPLVTQYGIGGAVLSLRGSNERLQNGAKWSLDSQPSASDLNTTMRKQGLLPNELTGKAKMPDELTEFMVLLLAVFVCFFATLMYFQK